MVSEHGTRSRFGRLRGRGTSTPDDLEAIEPAQLGFAVPADLGPARPMPEVSSTSTPPSRPHRRVRLGKQGITATVASVLFLALSAGVGLIPVPYVAWSPGISVDLAGQSGGTQAVQVSGVPTYPLHGRLEMTTVSVTRPDSSMALGQGLWQYFLPNHDVIPRNAVYAPERTSQENEAASVQQMVDARQDSVVAALRAAGEPVTEQPVVASVRLSGPNATVLKPGDVVRRVDGTAVTSVPEVEAAITSHEAGQPLVLQVQRAGSLEAVTLRQPSARQQSMGLGVEFGTGYQYTPRVSFGIDPSISGPSAGLVFALAIYDLISPDDLLGGRNIAGTGAIAPDGTVRPIGGIQEKIASAQSSGATMFLVPQGNCADLAGIHTTMRLVRVDSLRQAIAALERLKTASSTEEVAHC